MAEERTIREKLTEEVRDGFTKSTAVITRNTSEVLGDALGSLIDDLKGLTAGIFGVLKGTLNTITGGLFNNVEEKNLDENKKQTGLLTNILDMFQLQEKRQAREIKDEGDGVLQIVTTLAAAAAGVVAGYLATALGPFKALGGLIKPFTKGGLVFKLFSEVLPQRFDFLQKVGLKMGSVISKISGIFSTVTKALAESKAFGFGVIIGKMLFWFRFLWDSMKTVFSDMSIRDKILGVSSQLLALVAEIPELILNGLLKLFGSEFRVDFGKDAIIDAVNQFSDWLFPNFTVPVLDFFTKSVPSFFKDFIDKINPLNIFNEETIGTGIDLVKNTFMKIFNIPSKITDWLTNKIEGFFSNISGIFDNLFGMEDSNINSEMVKETFKKIFNIPSKITDWLKGKIEGIVSNIPDFLLPKSLENFKFNDKSPSSELPISETPDRQKNQISELKMETQRTNEKLDMLIKATESNGRSTTNLSNTVVAQQNNSGAGKNIPSENEHVGLNIMNGAMQ